MDTRRDKRVSQWRHLGGTLRSPDRCGSTAPVRASGHDDQAGLPACAGSSFPGYPSVVAHRLIRLKMVASKTSWSFAAAMPAFVRSSTIFLSRSISSCRSLSTSRLRRLFSRSSCSGFNGSFSRGCRCVALKHIHCQVFQAISRSKPKILKDFRNATFTGPELLLRLSVPGVTEYGHNGRIS